MALIQRETASCVYKYTAVRGGAGVGVLRAQNLEPEPDHLGSYNFLYIADKRPIKK